MVEYAPAMKDDNSRSGGFTPGRATRFCVPLLVQAFSQCLTYPLVASIVSHGADGVSVLTAFAQGQTVMFLIGALGGGLIMTGMVFARTRAGYRNFMRLNTGMAAVLLAVQALASLPPFDTFIFGHLLNLPPGLAETARRTLLWGLPLQATFFVRNLYLVILFNARASTAANNATLVRILLTLAASWLFVRLGWTGAMWGLAAMTVPCFVELALTWLFARPFERRLPDDAPAEPVRSQLRFTLPLSLGGFLLAAAPFMVATFVGRARDAVAMLAVHYVTIGLANAIGFAALRLQAVTIQFPPEHPRDRRTFRFALAVGLALGAVLLPAAFPGAGDWYFRIVQNLPAADVAKARIVMALYAAWPILQTVRGHAEGLAAVRRCPSAVLAGQIAYLGTLVAVLAVTLRLGLAGWLMGVTAILAATVATIAAVRGYLLLAGRDSRQSQPTAFQRVASS